MMKQLIPFEKDISFNTRLFEVTSISLDHDLSFKDNFANIFGPNAQEAYQKYRKKYLEITF